MNLEIFGQFHAGNSPKVFAFHKRRASGLCRTFQMLQAAPAALAIKRASRLRAVGTFFRDFNHPTPRKIFLILQDFDLAKFACKRPLHKAHASIRESGHAFAPLHHLFYAEFINHDPNIAFHAVHISFQP